MPEDLSRFTHIKGDRTKPEDLERAARTDQWDVVIDNIAYDAATVKQALKTFPKIKQYILTSTISVYRFAHAEHAQPLMEDSVDFDFNPPEEDNKNVHWIYARGKMEAERALIRQDAVPWTIIRPPIVYGPNDFTNRGFWYLGRLMKGGPIILPFGGVASTRFGFSQDVAHSYIPLIERPIALGRIYNVAQSEIITLRDFIDDSALILGKSPEYVSVPFEVAGDLGGPYAMDRNWIPDITAAKMDLGFMPTSWTKFSRLTANWFRDCWKGDEAKLFETREKELALAAQWAAKDAAGKANSAR